MEKRHFSLEMREDNKLTKVFQVIFGILCVTIAVYWLIYNFKSVKSDGTLWITVVFLTGFGCYLVWSGLGYAYRFIEFEDERIRVRKNSFMLANELRSTAIERIVVFPLKVTIERKSIKRPLLIRFGTSDIEKIEKIKDEFGSFAEANGIAFELRNEMDQ
jgi:hypothetical protein